MKLIREIPDVEKRIESGELSLTVASDVQSFLYGEVKEQRPYSLNAKIDLIETCLNKSKREVEREFVRRNPEREKRESVTFISNERLRVSFSISEELNQKLDHLKSLMSHSNPNLSTEGLLDILAELGLEKLDPIRKANRAEKRKAKVSPPPAEVDLASKKDQVELPQTSGTKTRYIKAEEQQRLIQKYDGLGCMYVDETTKRRCGSKRFLERDHIKPFSYGGPNTAENLQVLCAAHNRFRWERRADSLQNANRQTH